MEEVQEYKLYVGGLQKIPDGIKFSYYNFTHQYFLIYDTKKPEGDFLEVIPEILKELNQDERTWLAGCKLALSIEEISSNAEEVSRSLNSFAEILEKELKKEAEKVKNEKKE